MITIPYNDSNILYSGRFIEDDIGIRSAFQGNLTRFRVSGTTQVQVVADIKSIDDGGSVGLAVNVDNALETVATNYTGYTEVYEGERTVTINLPDTNEHDIVFKLSAGTPTNQLSGSSFIKIKSYVLDDGATVSPYPVGKKRFLFLGDSWMSAWHDWLRLMSPFEYETYPVAYGGAKSADINNAYPYQEGTTPKHGDGSFNGVVMGLGINDWVVGITESTFKANIQSLIDKVRDDHPNTKIFLLNPPRNTTDNKTFDKYGLVLSELATENKNIEYISSEPIWNELTWLSDTYHLTAGSKQIFADFVESNILKPTGKVTIQIGDIITNLPAYNPRDIDSKVRIFLDGEKSLRLVDVNSKNATRVQIYINGEIKAISK